MKTMPRTTLFLMRFLVERMLTRISKWEDRHTSEDHQDYRMAYLNSGLWQASQSMRELLHDEYNPMRKHEVGTVGKPWLTDQQLGEHYAAEMFNRHPIPFRVN